MNTLSGPKSYNLSKVLPKTSSLKYSAFSSSLINSSTGFVAMNSGNRYRGRSTNPRAFRTMATTASPQVTFCRGSTPTIRSISLAKSISWHTMATMPRWSMFLLLYSTKLAVSPAYACVFGYINTHMLR